MTFADLEEDKNVTYDQFLSVFRDYAEGPSGVSRISPKVVIDIIRRIEPTPGQREELAALAKKAIRETEKNRIAEEYQVVVDFLEKN